MSKNEMHVVTSESISILRRCAGDCGNMVEYTIIDDDDDCAPDVAPRTATVQYAGGHLCVECAATVRNALKSRREARTGVALQRQPGPAHTKR